MAVTADLPAVSEWQFHSLLDSPAESYQLSYSPYYVSHTLHRVLAWVVTAVHTNRCFTQYRRSTSSNSLLVKRTQILAWHPWHADAEIYRLIAHMNLHDHKYPLPPDLAAFAVELFRRYKPWIRPQVPYETVREYTRMCSILNDTVSGNDGLPSVARKWRQIT